MARQGYCSLQADDIELRLKNDERVLKCDRITKEQAFAELNEALRSVIAEGLYPEGVIQAAPERCRTDR